MNVRDLCVNEGGTSESFYPYFIKMHSKWFTEGLSMSYIHEFAYLFFIFSRSFLPSVFAFVPSASISLSLLLLFMHLCNAVNEGRPLHPDQRSGEKVGRKEAKRGRKGRDEQNFNELSLMIPRSSVMVTQHCRSVAGWSRTPRIRVLHVGRVRGKSVGMRNTLVWWEQIFHLIQVWICKDRPASHIIRW